MVVYVLSERSGIVYDADTATGRCSCPASTFRPDRACKHVKALSRFYEQHGGMETPGAVGIVGSRALARDGDTTAHRPTMKSLIDYIERLTMAGGDHDGEPFTLLPWERRFLRGAFAVDGDAALSVARGNGKSALTAGIACATVDPDGPLHGHRREVVVVAAAFAQARIIYEDVLSMLREKSGGRLDSKTWRTQDSQNAALLEHRESGARIRCTGSDPKTAHGLRPSLALLDEPSQWESARADKMLAAIRTGLGKVPGSRLIALGTRASNDEHWFSVMLAGGAAYAQSHHAGESDNPFAMATIRKANPSLAHLPSLKKRLLLERDGARRDPVMLASWRSLRLNQGTSDVIEAHLLAAGTWEAIEGECEESGPFALGVDLGSTAAQSAVAAYWPATGRLDAVACFPSIPSLAERGLSDGVGVLYQRMAGAGELLTLGLHVSDVAALLREAFDRWGVPSIIVSDRWREGDLRDALTAAGFPMTALALRGQGFKDGAEDVRAFQRAALDGRLTPRPLLLLRSAMAEARVVTDTAGASKLSKGVQAGRRLRARDDAVAAAILAVAEGSRRSARSRPVEDPGGGGLRLSIVG